VKYPAIMPAVQVTAKAIVRSPLRALLALLLALSLLIPAHTLTAYADDATDTLLDQLFVQLRDAPDELAAKTASDRIWTVWTNPTDPDLAARMLDVMEARTMRSLETTLELLDQLVLDYPDYAEGWNQRATLHFMRGDYEASIADCARALELEPRHFGALSGRAMMYLQQGKRSLALRDMQAALALHPFLGERHLFPELAQEMTRT
jgi:tetratricopeptide (TPR) repeat protein